MSEILVQVMRGGRVESIHRGHVAVVDVAGRVLAYAGDPYMRTYFRSAAKPIQAMNAILSGAADRFGLSPEELAVMCGSHYAEAFHRRAVLGILEKAGLTPAALRSPATPSLKQGIALRQAREGHVWDAVDSNCSGKHSGFLAACVARGYATEGYDDPHHPVQQDIVKIIAEMCELPQAAIGIGEDGCGVPVHYLSLYHMALGYAKFANPESLSASYADACRRLFAAMNAAPEMVAGTGGFCTELMRQTGGKLMGKLGADGVYCVGVKGRDLGLAVKIEDGNTGRLAPVVISALRQLGVLSDVELRRLERFAEPQNINEHKRLVGEILPVFELRRND